MHVELVARQLDLQTGRLPSIYPSSSRCQTFP